MILQTYDSKYDGIQQDKVCLFDLILYVPSIIFQLYRDESSWVEPVLSWDKCVLLKDHNAVTPLRFEPAALQSRVKHSTTEATALPQQQDEVFYTYPANIFCPESVVCFLCLLQMLKSTLSYKFCGHVYSSWVWSTILHSSETWSLTKTNLQHNKRAIIRQICSIKPEEEATVRSSELLSKLELEDLILREKRLRWFGHVECSGGAIRTACDIQINGRQGAGRPKLSWKKLMEKYCREWKLTTVDPQERSTWRSGVRSAICAASQYPGRGPTYVDDAPASAG